MIEIVYSQQKYPGDIIEDVKTGRIHVVCMAQNGLTHLNVYASAFLNLPHTIINQCVDLVNETKETGTLFPNAFITILPKSEKLQAWNKNPQLLTSTELRHCIEDVFKANEEYLKSEIIYFSLEGSYVDIAAAKEIVGELVYYYNHKNTYVKIIWLSD